MKTRIVLSIQQVLERENHEVTVKTMKAHSERLQEDLNDALARIEIHNAKAEIQKHLLQESDIQAWFQV